MSGRPPGSGGFGTEKGGGGDEGRGGCGGRGGGGGRGGRGGGYQSAQNAQPNRSGQTNQHKQATFAHRPAQSTHASGSGNARVEPTSRPINGVETNADLQKQQQAIDKHAKQLAKKEGTGPDVIRLRDGLRPATPASPANAISGRVVTNYLDLSKLPRTMWVYDVDMIRERGAYVVRVHNREDKVILMRDILVPRVPELQQSPQKWVTDGSLIWSVVDLFRSGDPQPVTNLPTYHNECGVALPIAEISIKLRLQIPTTQEIGELFDIPTGTSYRSSTPSLLLRGLNAFLTNHARGLPNANVFTSGQKSFDATRVGPEFIIDKGSPPDRLSILRALKGFVLSARPGTDRILVNINTAYSAFFEQNTVDQFLRSNSYRKFSSNRQTALLKGLKVQIVYSPVKDQQPANSDKRFIVRIGKAVNQELCHNNTTTVLNCFNDHSMACGRGVQSPTDNSRALPSTPAVQVARSSAQYPADNRANGILRLC